MHTDLLTPTQLAVLDGLRPIPAVHAFYLAGGTALALRHGHRRSIDFDFFRTNRFDAQDLVVTLERTFGGLERLPAGEHSLYVRVFQQFFTAEATRLLATATAEDR